MSLFIQLAAIDLKSYFRNSFALFFTFLFPVLLLFLLMLAFGGENGPAKVSVKISGDGPRAEKYTEDMKNILDYSRIIIFNIEPLDETSENQKGVVVTIPEDPAKKVSILVQKDAPLSIYNSIYPLMLVNSMQEIDYEKWDYVLNVFEPSEASLGNNFKYGQYLIPGLIGMILISTSLFGFCTFLVEQRAKGAFKAYHLYPLQKWKFIAAFTSTRFLILLTFSMVFLVIADKVYGMNAVFNLALIGKLVLLISLGALTFLSIALLISARIMAVSMVTGIANLLFYPATFASDLYIPQGGFPQIVKTIANIFPLGPFATAMRDITYKGAALSDISYALGLMSVWTMACFGLTLILFKWTKD